MDRHDLFRDRLADRLVRHLALAREFRLEGSAPLVDFPLGFPCHYDHHVAHGYDPELPGCQHESRGQHPAGMLISALQIPNKNGNGLLSLKSLAVFPA